jgi:hypothetical protein
LLENFSNLAFLFVILRHHISFLIGAVGDHDGNFFFRFPNLYAICIDTFPEARVGFPALPEKK